MAREERIGSMLDKLEKTSKELKQKAKSQIEVESQLQKNVADVQQNGISNLNSRVSTIHQGLSEVSSPSSEMNTSFSSSYNIYYSPSRSSHSSHSSTSPSHINHSHSQPLRTTELETRLMLSNLEASLKSKVRSLK